MIKGILVCIKKHIQVVSIQVKTTVISIAKIQDNSLEKDIIIMSIQTHHKEISIYLF